MQLQVLGEFAEAVRTDWVQNIKVFFGLEQPERPLQRFLADDFVVAICFPFPVCKSVVQLWEILETPNFLWHT